MTPISHLNKETYKNITSVNALALAVFVLLFLMSTLVHANHIASNAIHAEQQECYICHQGIDTPPVLTQVKNIFVASYYTDLYDLSIAKFKVNNFVQPPLRAPPVIL